MLWVLFLLPSLLGAAGASPSTGPQECARGAAVWCRDLRAAVACGAVQHCRGTVWNKPTAASLTCNTCLDVVTAANKRRNPSVTEGNNLAMISMLCDLILELQLAVFCDGLVGTQGSIIPSMMDEAVPLCAALTLCQPLQSRLDSPGPLSKEDMSEAPFVANGSLGFHHQQVPEGAVCQDCVRLITHLRDTVGSNPPKLAEVTAQEQCASLGAGLAPLCKSYVHQLFAPTDQALRFTGPAETCVKRGFCGERKGLPRLDPTATVDRVLSPELAAPRKRTELQMQTGLTCDVCLQVVREVDQWLEANSTQALVSRALERVCAVMPRSVVQQCITLVDTYSSSLVELVSRVTPERVCSTIRLCGTRRWARAIHRTHRPHGVHATSPAPELDPESQGSFCSGCKKLLSMSSNNLDSRSTKREILNAFKGGCSLLPLPYMIQCSHFVTQYEPVLIESLKEVLNPDTLCKKAGACHPARTKLLGTDQCAMGPSFWCKSQEVAQMCDAVQHCQRHVWKDASFQDGEHA